MEAEERVTNHPQNTSEIYATVKIPEIVKGLSPEDIKQMEKDKAAYQKMIMDEYNKEQEEVVGADLFMGMSDEEILMNRREFEEIGLL